MINNKYLAVIFGILALLATTPVPCRSQPAAAEIPILTQYVGHSDMFFARSDDSGILTAADDAYNGNRSGEWSNVLVAVTGWPGPRKIRSLTEVWTDTSGRPHSLRVLKLQLEFNDELRSKAYFPGRSQKVEGLVLESGVLDKQTLSIPYTKLDSRTLILSQKLHHERLVASAHSAIDPAAAIERAEFASYVTEKLREAESKLGPLREAIDAVPLTQTSHIPASRAHIDARDGLRNLEFAWAGLSSTTTDKFGNVRYHSGDRDVPERSVKEFVDPAGMTSSVVSDLLDKEAAAAKAVGIAENLFKDLFSPP